MNVSLPPRHPTHDRDTIRTVGTTSTHKTGRSRHAPLDSRAYADAIFNYSTLTAAQSLYPGCHVKRLAAYLQQPYEERVPSLDSHSRRTDDSSKHKFVTLYDLNPASTSRVKHLDSVSEFEAEAENLLMGTYGHLVFLRGNPTPEWLLSIGAKYRIEPEYLQRHLDFQSCQTDYYTSSPLPSANSSMFKLCITTIGTSVARSYVHDPWQALESLQTRNAEALQDYREVLKKTDGSGLGNSVIRHCSVHDLYNCTIEQDMSVFVFDTLHSWVGIIWLDQGSDLSRGPASTLVSSPLGTQPWQINYLPVVQFKRGMALRQGLKYPRLGKDNEGSRSTASKKSDMSQSASLLHLNYGRDLDRTVAANDAFYALHELFAFAAASEAQFLTMLEHVLQKELDHSALVHNKAPTLSKLLYNQQVLDRHTQRLKQNLAGIHAQSHEPWPCGELDEDGARRADAAAAKLARDYEFLLGRATDLAERCRQGMRIVMSNAAIKEARDSIAQAERVSKLTQLAFVFVPLSFTATFFGMNFRQLGTGALSIYVWFVVSVPVLLISLLFMYVDVWSAVGRYVKTARIRSRMWNAHRKAKAKAAIELSRV